MSTQTFSLMNPQGEPQKAAFQVAGRAGLEGKTVGLFWNGKPGGNVFMDEVGRQLASRFNARIVKIWEERPETVTSLGNSKENLEYMAKSADIVLAASSD